MLFVVLRLHGRIYLPNVSRFDQKFITITKNSFKGGEMKKKIVVLNAILILLAIVSITLANERKPTQIVPLHEHELASKLNLSGPTETKGIESVRVLGAIGLEKDFSSLVDKQLRARELVIKPGGVVAVHQHDSRPGVAYILEGEIVEHRNDQLEPILRTKGAVAFEQSGVAHWWENKSNKSVRALVVDIISK